MRKKWNELRAAQLNITLIFIILFISGCSLAPVPSLKNEIKERAFLDHVLVTHNQEHVNAPISLYEAIARALKYNLDYRLEIAEKILRDAELDVSSYELLPQLVAKTGYNGRDKFSGSTSRSLISGSQSLESSTSADRDIFTTDLELTGNVLDFGLSYIRAKQSADKTLIKEQEKRKVINRIVQDVYTAYWRAVSYDRLNKKMETFLVRVTRAIEESKQVESQRLSNPLIALTYQRELLSIKRELEELQRTLSVAKIQLAALMNLRPGEYYELLIPDRPENIVNKVDMFPETMEQIALENRPELRIAAYEHRINKEEAKAAILNLIPGLNINFGKSHSTNTFLFHNNWLSYGAQISWNLLNIFKFPATNRQLNAKDKVLEARRLALSMAIMTQVHVTLARYRYAQYQYNTAANFYQTQKAILEQVSAKVMAKAMSQQSLIREEMNMIVAEARYDVTYSDVENAYASLFSVLGILPFPIDLDFSSTVENLTDLISKYFEELSFQEQSFSLKLE